MSNAKLSAFTTIVLIHHRLDNESRVPCRELVGHAAPLRESGFSSETFHFML